MIQVPFSEPDTPEWKAWRKDADKARDELIAKVAAGSDPKINKKLYKRMRQVIFDAFHGKCAYCEGKFILDQTGDVEHFRPKQAVLDENWQPVLIQSSGSMVEHLGYYWLAYDWCNLLPSCGKCNRVSRTREGKLVGKGARFPVNEFRAKLPGEENLEEPLFLHPVFDNPDEHLVFDEKTGILGSKSERGEACIELLDLNREGLPEARRKVYEDLIARMHEALSALNFGVTVKFRATVELMTAYKDGKEEYSLAGRKALQHNRVQLSLYLQMYLDVLNSQC